MGAKKTRIAIMGSRGYIGRNLRRAVSSGRLEIELIPVMREKIKALYSGHNILDHMLEYPYDDCEPDDTPYEDEHYDKMADDKGIRSVMNRIRDSDLFINLAGAGRQSASSPFYMSVEMSAAVAVFLARQAHVPIVHMSGLGASSAKNPIAYMGAKHAAESIIKNSGLHYTILRPSYVVGRGDHLSEYVKDGRRAAAGKKDVALDVYASPRVMQPIHIDDVTSVIIWSVQKLLQTARDSKYSSKPRGMILDLVGPDRIPFYDYMCMLAKNARVPDINPITMETAYIEALRHPESAPFGVDDLGIIAGGYTGDHEKLTDVTKIKPRSVLDILESGGLP